MKARKDMSFDELVTFLSWHAMEQILKGVPFKTVIFTVCDTAVMWRSEQNERKKTP